MKNFNPPWHKIPVAKQPWRKVAKNYKTLILEIGSGVGYFAIQYAQQNPEHYIIAIEKTSEKYAKFAHRLKNHSQIENIHAVHANAIQWIWQNLNANEINEIFILYPNPYPKEKQKNKRFHNMPFMQYLLTCLQPNGLITQVTNIKAYADEMHVVAQNSPKLKIKNFCEFITITKARTHFEKKYLARGETCYELTCLHIKKVY